ncbi:hypothetical protein [Limosilactobacillus reuteri]|uniref:hypothetical protein n=1 Tax=Limosilactobacillus reuteri TaxID=1598 RepID=UPI0013043C53|nr:hypothetical protein [Limosilactobacillus reuteri]MCC4486972.1 hypothetical protein [Limosilactobacillus reuteri]
MKNLVVKKQKVKFKFYKATNREGYPVNIAGLLHRVIYLLKNNQKKVKLYGVTVRIDV